MKLADIAARWRRARAYRADQRDWYEADSLADLGELTAQYVTRARLSYPDHGYASSPGPDRETIEISADLAWLCRAGLPTHGSQPGTWSVDRSELYDASAYGQRAAVEMLAPPQMAEQIVWRAHAAGLLAHATLVADLGRKPRHVPAGRAIPVSVYTDDEVPDDPASIDVLGPTEGVDWTVQTMFGGISRDGLSFLLTGIGDGAARAVEASAYVTVVDPVWGRQRRLWDCLTGAVIGARKALR